jgi:hypothetical protein
MVNSFFNADDYGINDLTSGSGYEGVVRQYIDERFYFELDSARAKKGNVFLSLAEINLQDDYMQLGQPSGTIEFLEILNFN